MGKYKRLKESFYEMPMSVTSFFDIVTKASRNEKQRRVKFASSWFMNGTRNLSSIGSFGIVSPENPNSKRPSEDDKEANKINSRYNDEFKKIMRRNRFVYLPVEGHYGNEEQSYIIFNISLTMLEYIAAKFEQTSFFYCYPENETDIVSEYYEKRHKGENWNAKDNPYEFINKTTVYHDMKDAKDNFTIIGGKYKFTIDLSVFDKIGECLERNLDLLCEQWSRYSRERIIDLAFNGVGQVPSIFYEGLIKDIITE